MSTVRLKVLPKDPIGGVQKVDVSMSMDMSTWTNIGNFNLHKDGFIWNRGIETAPLNGDDLEFMDAAIRDFCSLYEWGTISLVLRD